MGLLRPPGAPAPKAAKPEDAALPLAKRARTEGAAVWAAPVSSEFSENVGAAPVRARGRGRGRGGEPGEAAPKRQRRPKADPAKSEQAEQTSSDVAGVKVRRTRKPSLPSKCSVKCQSWPAPEVPQGPPLEWQWENTAFWARFQPDLAPAAPTRIAAFDFDGCLAKTYLFHKGPDAWQVKFPGAMEEAMQELHSLGFALAIFCNQAAIGLAQKKREELVQEKRGRFEGFARKLGLPLFIMASTAHSRQREDIYRKPNTGMWDFAKHHFGPQVQPGKSFYVGDGAGRARDQDDMDVNFALNIGFRFLNPDEFFREKAYKPFL